MGVKGDLAKIALTAPACAQAKDKVALSRRIDKHWRLVGKSKLVNYARERRRDADIVVAVFRLGRGRTWYPRRGPGRLDITIISLCLYKLHLYRLSILSLDIMVTPSTVTPFRHPGMGQLGVPQRLLDRWSDGSAVSAMKRHCVDQQLYLSLARHPRSANLLRQL